MTKDYRLGPARRALNTVLTAALRAGIGPRTSRLLTVVGRKSGLPRTTPVTLVERDGTLWLVAPYGPVAWVHNVRAAGEVTLRKGRRTEVRAAVEAGPDEAAPVLREYVQRVAVVRPYVAAGPHAPLAEFEAVAHRHPVFRLGPVRTLQG